jgi:molybdenum-dependent DNA-binding transcriptional regulator ModE
MDSLLTPLHPIRAARFDGWTPARQWGFLRALADLVSVSRAARSVGMSATAAYRLRRHPAADAARADLVRRNQ